MTTSESLREIADRIRRQGDVAARLGQYDDLYDLAEEVDRLAMSLSPNPFQNNDSVCQCGHFLSRHAAQEGMCLDCRCYGWEVPSNDGSRSTP